MLSIRGLCIIELLSQKMACLQANYGFTSCYRRALRASRLRVLPGQPCLWFGGRRMRAPYSPPCRQRYGRTLVVPSLVWPRQSGESSSGEHIDWHVNTRAKTARLSVSHIGLIKFFLFPAEKGPDRAALANAPSG